MNVVKPITITSSNLTASNVPETDYPTWVVGTTYALDAYVIYQNKIYKSMQASNTGHYPISSVGWWSYVSATNRYKMFDLYNSTKTTNPTTITFSVSLSSIVTHVAFLGVVADSIRVKMTDATDGVVFDNTYSMVSQSNVLTIYDYFFADILNKTTLIVDGFPSYSVTTLDVTITATGTAECATCIIGKATTLGCTVYGAGVGIVDYSRKVADDFGGYTIVERAFSKRGSFNIVTDSGGTDYLYDFLSSIRAQPSLFIGSDRYANTIIFGFFKDFTINLQNPVKSDITIEIEGLT